MRREALRIADLLEFADLVFGGKTRARMAADSSTSTRLGTASRVCARAVARNARHTNTASSICFGTKMKISSWIFNYPLTNLPIYQILKSPIYQILPKPFSH